MNDFVNECRREWKRLGVPRSAADEMAAELAADLNDGTPEEVLGSDAFDAQSFARAWATERGVLGSRRRSRIPAVLAALALIPTIVGAVLVLTSNDDVTAAAPPPGDRVIWIAPSPSNPETVLAMAPHDRVLVLQQHARSLAEPNNDSNTLGNVLLIVGLAVLVPSTLLWSGRVALKR